MANNSLLQPTVERQERADRLRAELARQGCYPTGPIEDADDRAFAREWLAEVAATLGADDCLALAVLGSELQGTVSAGRPRRERTAPPSLEEALRLFVQVTPEQRAAILASTAAYVTDQAEALAKALGA